jgi:hypothetical protein
MALYRALNAVASPLTFAFTQVVDRLQSGYLVCKKVITAGVAVVTLVRRVANLRQAYREVRAQILGPHDQCFVVRWSSSFVAWIQVFQTEFDLAAVAP